VVFMGKSVRQLPFQLAAFCLPRKSGMGQPQGQTRSFIPLSPGHERRGNALQVAKNLPNALHTPSQSTTRLRPIITSADLPPARATTNPLTGGARIAWGTRSGRHGVSAGGGRGHFPCVWPGKHQTVPQLLEPPQAPFDISAGRPTPPTNRERGNPVPRTNTTSFRSRSDSMPHLHVLFKVST
jgi:hypothetical protein